MNRRSDSLWLGVDWFSILCLFIGILIGMVLTLGFPMSNVKGRGLEKLGSIRSLNCQSPTPFAVMYEIKRVGIKNPQIAFNQVRLETGFDTCSLGFRTNNLWCFATNKHLRFDHWRESVAWYRVWQIRTGYDTGDYYNHLAKYWGAEDMEAYITNLKRFR